MSFFADMLAGAAGGLGQGMVNYAQMDERDKREEEARQEKAALALELQRQRSEDKALALAMRYGEGGAGGGGSGSSRGGKSNAADAMMADTDPESQDRNIRKVEALQGQAAAATLAKFYGRPLQEQADLTKEIGVRADDEGNPLAPAMVTRNVSYDVKEGQRGLARVYALLGGADKFDDYTKGEARAAGTDAVLGAKDDTGLRKAGAINMALEGKDRFGVSDGTQYDKAGVVDSTTTEVGRSKVRENNAQADRARTGGTGAAPTTIFKTVTDESGNVMGVRRDGSTVDLGVKSDAFNRQVATQITRMAEEPGFRKLSEPQKREAAIARLMGGRDTAAPAATPAPPPPAGTSGGWSIKRKG